jgi:hypothetical protein
MLAQPLAAQADPKWNHDDHGHGRGHEKHDVRGWHDGRHVVFRNEDRVIVRNYIGEDYRRRHCPPGLAKKHNGCRPPGHVRHYVIGQPLPQAVVWQPVPQPLLVQLQPAPYGYRYMMVDNDVLLISLATREVADAITLLSAVGR